MAKTPRRGGALAFSVENDNMNFSLAALEMPLSDTDPEDNSCFMPREVRPLVVRFIYLKTIEN
jgi:hypothetical protein